MATAAASIATGSEDATSPTSARKPYVPTLFSSANPPASMLQSSSGSGGGEQMSAGNVFMMGGAGGFGGGSGSAASSTANSQHASPDFLAQAVASAVANLFSCDAMRKNRWLNLKPISVSSCHIKPHWKTDLPIDANAEAYFNDQSPTMMEATPEAASEPTLTTGGDSSISSQKQHAVTLPPEDSSAAPTTSTGNTVISMAANHHRVSLASSSTKVVASSPHPSRNYRGAPTSSSSNKERDLQNTSVSGGAAAPRKPSAESTAASTGTEQQQPVSERTTAADEPSASQSLDAAATSQLQSGERMSPETFGNFYLQTAMRRLKLETDVALQSERIYYLCNQKSALETLTAEKKRVKEELKSYDYAFQAMFGTLPGRRQKEPMRPLYAYYKKLRAHLLVREESHARGTTDSGGTASTPTGSTPVAGHDHRPVAAAAGRSSSMQQQPHHGGRPIVAAASSSSSSFGGGGFGRAAAAAASGSKATTGSRRDYFLTRSKSDGAEEGRGSAAAPSSSSSNIQYESGLSGKGDGDFAAEDLRRRLHKLEEQKAFITQRLQRYQDSFLKTYGRRIVFHKDIVPMEGDYKKYKLLREQIAKLRESLSKRSQRSVHSENHQSPTASPSPPVGEANSSGGQ